MASTAARPSTASHRRPRPRPRPRLRDADRLLLRTARRGAWWNVLLGAAALTDALAATFLPIAMAGAVDAALGGGGASRAIPLCGALIVASAAAEVLSELATGCGQARATAWLRRLLVGRVLAAGPASPVRPGDLTSRVVTGAAEAGVAPVAATRAVVAAVTPAGALAVLGVLDWRLALTVAVALPLVGLLLRVFVRDITRTVHRYLALQGTIAARLAEAMGGARTIAAARTSERELARVLAPLPDLRAEGHATWDAQGRVAARSLLTLLLLQVAVLAVAGAELTAGRISPGELVAAVQYTGLAAGFGPVLSNLVRLGRARAGAARAAEVLAEPVRAYGTREPPPGRGLLEFRGVSKGGVLHDLDLVVPSGAAVAVVGRSGAGKSLLAALAGRLTDPDRGEVRLDGTALPRLGRTALRRAVGYAFDRPFLFGETVLDALAFGPDRPPDRDLRAAAEAACADGFIRRLPLEYGTPLAAAPLSGGERQRLGLARAFAHAGRVLVLDDATSSLDTATELRITDALLGGPLGGRTRLIIAHRAGTAARADLVVWLDGGRVRAQGPHHVLWRCPDYRAVFGVDGE
ncbi:ABC transporter ATP-binding protein [Actinomadura chibensis]|uniref:ABC transporter ATP-binding protein n=1 Tax=Actinomadura chibensis TaxID=392828 RepID=A0A5D0NKA5_9ACTN|nr:ABC transporter ATP-binding protein [Actinomadura chibensis]TYB44877.1 ABC transporter ATP-binding protein [Actinomadura chibensis]